MKRNKCVLAMRKFGQIEYGLRSVADSLVQGNRRQAAHHISNVMAEVDRLKKLGRSRVLSDLDKKAMSFQRRLLSARSLRGVFPLKKEFALMFSAANRALKEAKKTHCG